MPVKKETKKIGAYLVEDHACDPAAIAQSLGEQAALEKSGRYRSLGRIMVERGSLDPRALRKGLNRQYMDILSASDLFHSLSGELLEVLVRIAEDRVVPGGSIVCEEGDQGDTFWMIITGSVRVFHHVEDAGQETLSVLSAGDGFGEMSLLTGEPRSASVETVVPSRFLVISRNDFNRVVSENSELAAAVARILAERLKAATHNLGRASVTKRAYQRFVSEYQAGPQLDLVGASRVMGELRERIEKSARGTAPLLLFGPVGSEKKSVGWHIHRIDPGPDAPFLVVDAKTVTLGREVRSGDDPAERELAQAGVLFGHVRGGQPLAVHTRLGLLQVADTGTLVIENCEYLAPGVQHSLAAFIKTGLFQPLGGTESIGSRVRIVLTATAGPDLLMEQGLIVKQMYDLLGSGTIEIPPLSHRKKDLRAITLYLVDHFGRAAGKPVHEIRRETFEEILAYDWPGNMDDLEVVIRRGVSLARGGVLAPEDLFIGRMPATGRYTFNLLQFPAIRGFFQGNAFPRIGQLASGFFFLLILGFGLFGPLEPERNLSLVLTWGLWEPLVILSALLLGRVWCSVCPVGAAGSIVSGRGMKKNAPAFLRSHGILLSGLGLALIYWAEVAFHMAGSPRATATLLLTIISGAVIFGILYQRRAWCRYLCPLGKLVGVLSSCSPLELRANYPVCNNECRDHACYVGARQCAAGCPMSLGPFALHTNIDCIFCGNCIKNCSNNAPRINLRLPAYELWADDRVERAVALFVPMLIATQIFRGLADGGMVSVLPAGLDPALYQLAVMAVVIAVVFAYFRIAGWAVFAEDHDPPAQKAGILAKALLLPAAFFELGYHAERFLTSGGTLFSVAGRQFGIAWPIPQAVASPWGIISLQIFFIAIGAVSGTAVLKKISAARGQGTGNPSAGYRRWPVLLPVFAFIVIAVAC